jgi:hypothetical protein
MAEREIDFRSLRKYNHNQRLHGDDHSLYTARCKALVLIDTHASDATSLPSRIRAQPCKHYSLPLATPPMHVDHRFVLCNQFDDASSPGSGETLLEELLGLVGPLAQRFW